MRQYSGTRIDKFKVFRLTPEPASQVAAPLIVECYANLECKVVDTRIVTKYDFFILEVSKAWIDPSWKAEEILDAAFARGFALAHP